MSKLIDISGRRFGFWLVQGRGDNKTNGQVQWSCLCDCGELRLVTSNSLRSGNSTSCGCNHVPNLVDVLFGNLTVLRLDTTKCKGSRRYWVCQCSCGGMISVSTHKLRENITTSCGYCISNNIGSVQTVSKQFNGLLNDITTNFHTAEELIVGSRNLSELNGKPMMNSGIAMIRDQILIIINLNENLQNSIDVLSLLNRTIKDTTALDHALTETNALKNGIKRP